MVNDPASRPFDTVQDLGIGIRTLRGESQLHIGILHKVENGSALLLHLRHHFDLKNEPPANEFRWLQIELDDINRRLVVSLCRAIAEKARNVSFGFTYTGIYFSDLGEYISQPTGHGLTCATFVMAVFAKLRIPLLILAGWPNRPDDPVWQAGQANYLRQRFGFLLADAVAAHIGEPRYRPEEVSAGAVSRGRPLDFVTAAAMGDRIKRELLRSYRGSPP